MSLKEYTYSIFIISATDRFATSISDLLLKSKYSPVHTATSISAAKRVLTERTYDFIIINSPLPDDTGTHFAIDTCIKKQTVVLLLAKADIHAAIHDKVAEYGVFTLPKPTSKPILTQALSWMESMRERLRQFEKKSTSIEEKMKEIRLVNKAKWILITELKMSEPDAHHYIEKQAMDQCVTKKCIAENIIKTYAHPCCNKPETLRPS